MYIKPAFCLCKFSAFFIEGILFYISKKLSDFVAKNYEDRLKIEYDCNKIVKLYDIPNDSKIIDEHNEVVPVIKSA